jgi:hypothetical protein
VGFLQSFVPLIAGKTHDWIESQRAEHIPRSRPLTTTERVALASHFSDECLSSARVAQVDRVPSPPFFGGILRQLEFIGKRVHFDFSAASGITFGECILVAVPGPPIDLLFHELVHVEQYRMLGMKGFAQAYVQGIVDSNFIYEKIPLEAIAFAMSGRFTAGESFVVGEELPGWFDQMGYKAEKA